MDAEVTKILTLSIIALLALTFTVVPVMLVGGSLLERINYSLDLRAYHRQQNQALRRRERELRLQERESRLQGAKKRRLREDQGPQAICQCDHGLAFHSPTGEGAGTGSDCNGDDGSCGCRQYVGPTPLTEYFAPKIVDPQNSQ